MTEPCIKKQCIRKQETKPFVYSNWAWCSCGHNAIHHNWGTVFGRYCKGACKDCVCSKFDFIGYYTYDTIDKVPLCTENDD